ncbi:hypothetical protein RB653_009864 [Dictyostelium firmibasis]|uniref:Carbohydrate binding domain-containing protein n=1 Tax=Dictyostelium firmibasis TaxID=79012 RepID=A0AAN7YP27_9MYCE
MKYLNIFLILFVFLIGSVLSDDEIKVIRVERVGSIEYGSIDCLVRFNVLIDFPRTIVITQSIGGVVSGDASIKNGTLTLFQIKHKVPVGISNVSFQAFDYTNYQYPGQLVYINITNYAIAQCDALPSNFKFISKQDKWFSVSGFSNPFSWTKILIPVNIDLSKGFSNYEFSCQVPEPFGCEFHPTINGDQKRNYFLQVYISPSSKNIPFTPLFNVLVKSNQGTIVFNSTFDGLKDPTNPPMQVINFESFPPVNSVLNLNEMTNVATFITQIINNKNTLTSISREDDDMLTNQLIPLVGSISNATFIGMTELINAPQNIKMNLQIIDSQGAKRIGGDLSFSTKKNDLYPFFDTNMKTSISNETIFGENFLYLSNVKFETSYDPTMTVTFSDQWSIDNLKPSYPFGISNGTLYKHSVSISSVTNSYYDGNLYCIRNGDHYSSESIANIIQNKTDSKDININKVELFNLSFDKVLVRIYAGDDFSGIKYIYNPYFRIESSDLVWGNPNNGVYEAIATMIFYNNMDTPSLFSKDYRGNDRSIYSDNPIIDTDFNKIPNYPSVNFYKDKAVDPFNFTSFSFKYNDVDVSNQPFNNTLCFGLSGADKKMVPQFFLLYSPLNIYAYQTDKPFIGAWDPIKNLFCVDFVIPARIFTGEINYIIFFSPFIYDRGYITASFGSSAQLRVTSTYADQLPPIVTELSTFPSNNVIVGSNQTTTIGWNIRIEDLTNGLLSAEFNITSDYDLTPITIKLTPNNAVSGNLKSGVYQLRFPVPLNCRSQSFKISSAKLIDTQGHYGVTPSTNNFNPFLKFLLSNQLNINVTCPYGDNDIKPPVLTSFSSSAPSTIDVGEFKESRTVVFNFTTTDLLSGISSKHAPIVYLSRPSYEKVSCQSKLESYTNGLANYTCTIEIPYGFGSYEVLLISIYGIVDNQLNMNGYSSFDLKSLGHQYSLKPTFSNKPVLDSTSTITNLASNLTIFGHKFGIDSSKVILQVDYQNGQGWKNTSISFYAGIVLITDSIIPSSSPFYVRVIVNNKISNSLLVVPTILPSQCNYQVDQTIISKWINSEIYPYLQASITIKNNGIKPIKAFSFMMANIDQIWGVTVTSGSTYSLPTWNPIINPGNEYTFGYILKGTDVGLLTNVNVDCS